MSEAKNPEETQSVEASFPARRAGLFYKLVVASILQDKKLKIPNKFVKRFGDDLSDLVTLVVPNGGESVLELKRCGRSLWLEDGWHDFVKHQGIQIGQLLVFKYEGNSIFKFYMFNLTATVNGRCDTSSASFEQVDSKECPATLGKETEYANLVEILGSSSPDPTPVSLSETVLHEFPHEQKCDRSFDEATFRNFMRWFDAKTLNLLMDFDKFQLPKSSQTDIRIDGDELLKTAEDVDLQFSDETGERTRKKKLKVEPIDNYSEPFFDEKFGNIPPKIPGIPLGVEEFKPVNPFCWIVMRQSYVRRGFHLHIPSRFAEKYLKGVSGFIVLQVSSGKQWRVRCIREGPGTKLSKGWAEFVFDNKLKEEDVCVFELIDVKDIVLKVTIFRVFNDPSKT